MSSSSSSSAPVHNRSNGIDTLADVALVDGALTLKVSKQTYEHIIKDMARRYKETLAKYEKAQSTLMGRLEKVEESRKEIVSIESYLRTIEKEFPQIVKDVDENPSVTDEEEYTQPSEPSKRKSKGEASSSSSPPPSKRVHLDGTQSLSEEAEKGFKTEQELLGEIYLNKHVYYNGKKGKVTHYDAEKGLFSVTLENSGRKIPVSKDKLIYRPVVGETVLLKPPYSWSTRNSYDAVKITKVTIPRLNQISLEFQFLDNKKTGKTERTIQVLDSILPIDETLAKEILKHEDSSKGIIYSLADINES